MIFKKTNFGKTAEGFSADLFFIKNKNDVEIEITNFGGIIKAIRFPDKKGNVKDVVLGFDSLSGYETNNPYFGCVVGRYANRIANGAFSLEGKKYTLARNNNENHLHGGIKGFNKVLWDAVDIIRENEAGVLLSYLSRDGEEGYPGNLSVKVEYLLNEKNELKINYYAKTDKPTIINLTNHSYFNLGGEQSNDILGHEIMINADRITPVDETLIPTGEFMEVADTPLDLRSFKNIGERINEDFTQLNYSGGYDHNWVINRQSDSPALAAVLRDPETGRGLEVFTTQPGIQFYTGNFLNGSIEGKSGKKYAKRSGLCLETQHFPDSPNKQNFPSTVLLPGDEYRHTTVFRLIIQRFKII
ncbi:MAG: galactose mutarotase [Spirochaetes bacterium]|nr:galactose mutarotase [Spirochaetota bacterium]